jgi:trehalose 6-phosphate synthase
VNRLVVVSNRIGDVANAAQKGGLVVALADALRTRGGVWFGWSGEIAEDAADVEPVVDELDNVLRVAVPLTQAEFDDYYVGYANSVLWPLLHYRVDLIDYRASYFKGYQRVNQRFAERLAPFLRGDDQVWVHDYHFIPLARYLRRLGCRQRMGFFLHIPFPSPDILLAAPNHDAIAKCLIQYDVIGFQTSTDAANFRRYVSENGLGEVDEDGTVRVGDRTIVVDRFPIGIDVDNFAGLATSASDEVRIEKMRRELLNRKQVIGVDRLDYSKGIPARFQAFEKLLDDNPSLERKVSLLQVAPPTREAIDAYARIRAETEGLAGRINGRFAAFDWTPIRYIHRSIGRDTLAALYRISEVGFVTPLRDGMNLVAKEYVAAQPPDDPGVLVLSQFAGAAEEMAEALIVNPHDIDEMARTLKLALDMPLDERRERHEALMQRIRRYDVASWADDFLAVLAAEPVVEHRLSA